MFYLVSDMCVSPIHIKNLDPHLFAGKVLTVPCGRCVECLKRRQDSWKLRLMEESNNYRFCYFFTLTYASDNLPISDFGVSTARKYDVQTWLKRFRMSYERRTGVRLSDSFKYFICAEYGPNGSHRPHYHGLFFTDLSSEDVAPLFSDWSSTKGFVKFDSICVNQGERQAVANYVAKYCCKGEFASRADDIAKGYIESAWTICSKGIGASYVTRNRSYHLPKKKSYYLSDLTRLDDVIDNMKVSFYDGKNTFTYSMPRYYRERLYQSKLPFKQKVYDVQTKTFKDKIVYRFCNKDLFSMSLQTRIRDRFFEKARRIEEMYDVSGFYGRFYRSEGSEYYKSSESERSFYCSLLSPDKASLDFRASKIRTSLFTFYASNASKYQHL